jgi:pyridoxamine 5'-phosphate oxidase
MAMLRVAAMAAVRVPKPYGSTMLEHELDSDPIRQFAAWFAAAQEAGVRYPETMALATASPDGRPSVRMVLLKGADERGFAFYTNRDSRKGRELAGNARAALVLYWQALGRQVRVEGAVEQVGFDESAAYWATRPRTSRLSAWASPQSDPLAGRDELEAAIAEVDGEFPGEDVPLPPHWGGYRVVPETIELWEHRDDRLHDRVLYSRDGDGWRMDRLAP